MPTYFKTISAHALALGNQIPDGNNADAFHVDDTTIYVRSLGSDNRAMGLLLSGPTPDAIVKAMRAPRWACCDPSHPSSRGHVTCPELQSVLMQHTASLADNWYAVSFWRGKPTITHVVPGAAERLDQILARGHDDDVVEVREAPWIRYEDPEAVAFGCFAKETLPGGWLPFALYDRHCVVRVGADLDPKGTPDMHAHMTALDSHFDFKLRGLGEVVYDTCPFAFRRSPKAGNEEIGSATERLARCPHDCF